MPKMHADEVETDGGLVRRLLAEQFPHWADLPVERVESAGTDNALYRLGGGLVARLPRIHWAAGLVEKEVRWLPALAPRLPLEIPVPLAMGRPGQGYPWNWSVCRWLDGESATVERIPDLRRLAVDLAGFLRALQAIDATGGPAGGAQNFERGVPLAVRDTQTRAAIARLGGLADGEAARRAWEATLSAPEYHGPPVWIHGDIQAGNLLVRDGRMRAVIDFGCLGAGDPACDLAVAWNLLDAGARAAFREAMQPDDAAWARGKGWALSIGVIALPYYHKTNPVLAGIARTDIEAVIADHK